MRAGLNFDLRDDLVLHDLGHDANESIARRLSARTLWSLRTGFGDSRFSEVDAFESEIELRKQGKIDEKIFAETRLRRGAYGQRYDNGQRHDGTASRKLPFADKPTKGPGTMWDAPGMLRIKVPFGGLNPAQLEVMADVAEEYSDNIAHITTRQDFQLHFIHIENGPSLMRRLGVNATARASFGLYNDESDVDTLADALAEAGAFFA